MCNCPGRPTSNSVSIIALPTDSNSDPDPNPDPNPGSNHVHAVAKDVPRSEIKSKIDVSVAVAANDLQKSFKTDRTGDIFDLESPLEAFNALFADPTLPTLTPHCQGKKEDGIVFDDEMMMDALDALYSFDDNEDSDNDNVYSRALSNAEASTSSNGPYAVEARGQGQAYRDPALSESRRLAYAFDTQDEEDPSEFEKWSNWPSALDEYQLDEALQELNEDEKGWLFFEMVSVEPRLLQDAPSGFPSQVFEAISTQSCDYLSVLPPDFEEFPMNEDDRSAREKRTDQDEEGEVWEERMKITVPQTECLLTLCQSQSIPRESRDQFISNLCLIAYPFAQYLFNFVTDLKLAKDRYALSFTSPVIPFSHSDDAASTCPTIERRDSKKGRKGGNVKAGRDEKKRWMKSFVRANRERKAAVRENMPDHWSGDGNGWNINWSTDTDKPNELTNRINSIGILANRPIPSLPFSSTSSFPDSPDVPKSSNSSNSPNSFDSSSSDPISLVTNFDLEDSSASAHLNPSENEEIDTKTTATTKSKSRISTESKTTIMSKSETEVEGKGKGKQGEKAKGKGKEKARDQMRTDLEESSDDRVIRQQDQELKSQLIRFEIEQSTLSILESLPPSLPSSCPYISVPSGSSGSPGHPGPKDDKDKDSRPNPAITKLKHLTHLSLALLRSPSAHHLHYHLEQIVDVLRDTWSGVHGVERELILVDPCFMWDMEVLGRYFAQLGIEFDIKRV